MNPTCQMCGGVGTVPGPMEHPELRQPCQLCARKEPLRFAIEFTQAPANKPNRNKRVYTQELLEKMAVQANEMAKDGRLLGEIGNPDDGKVHLDKVSHKALPKFRVEKGYLKGEFEILDTPQGRLLADMLKGNIVMRPRGFGSLVEGPNGTYTIGSDYKLSAVDVTVEPPDTLPQ